MPPDADDASGIPWRKRVVSDHGDGALALVPPAVSKNRLVVGLPETLATHNGNCPPSATAFIAPTNNCPAGVNSPLSAITSSVDATCPRLVANSRFRPGSSCRSRRQKSVTDRNE